MYAVTLEAIISSQYAIYVGIAQTRGDCSDSWGLLSLLSLLLKILLYILLEAFYLSISNT